MDDPVAATPEAAREAPAPATHYDVAPPTRTTRAMYAVVRGAVELFCRTYFRLRITGSEQLPKDKPFILAPVHRSNIDFLLVSAITRRRMRYMGKDTLWKYRWLAWFITALGAFPVRRGSADREALRRCQEIIEQGEPLVMFPEGTRQTGPVVEKVFDGPAYLAARMRVPIVPVGIGGSERAMPRGAKWLRPVKTAVIVGKPIEAEPSSASGRVTRSSVRNLSERLRTEVQRLFDEAQALV